MPRTYHEDDEDSDWEVDQVNDGDDTIPCPHCRKEIYDGAEQCPYCGQYISAEDSPLEARPLWIVIAAVLCLALAIFWNWRG